MYFKSEEELRNWILRKNLKKRIDKLAKELEGKRVLIYGAGMLFRVIKENFDLSGFNIIGVSDRTFYFTRQQEAYGLKSFSPYGINDINPEVILLATNYTYMIKDFFRDELNLNLDKIKIIPIVKKSFKERIDDFLVAAIKS